MLKKSLLFVSLAVLSGNLPAAGPTANLVVKGSITPPQCTINGEENTEIEYNFNVSPGAFPATGNLTLQGQAKTIEVICDAATYLSFTATDERDSSVLTAGANNFGLGMYGDDTKVGNYTVLMSNAKYKPTADTAAYTNGYIRPGTGSVASSAYLNKTTNFAWSTTTSGAPYALGQVFSADFTVTPTINAVLKNSDGSAQLDGLTVLAFAFGV